MRSLWSRICVIIYCISLSLIYCGAYYLATLHYSRLPCNIQIMVKAPNIAHLSILTSAGYNKKETNLKKKSQLNKEIIILYLHKVKNENYFLDL